MKSLVKTGLILNEKPPKKIEKESSTMTATIDLVNMAKIKSTIPLKTRIKAKSTTAAVMVRVVPVSTTHLPANTPVLETRTKIDITVAEIRIGRTVAEIKIGIIIAEIRIVIEVLRTRADILHLRNISHRLLRLKIRIEVTTRAHLILVQMIRNEAEMTVTISINPKNLNTKYVCMNPI